MLVSYALRRQKSEGGRPIRGAIEHVWEERRALLGLPPFDQALRQWATEGRSLSEQVEAIRIVTDLKPARNTVRLWQRTNQIPTKEAAA